MSIHRSLLLLPLLLILTACFWGDEYEDEQIVGNYYVSGLDGGWEEPMKDAYLHFHDEKFGLADALFPRTLSNIGFSKKCLIMLTSPPNEQYYIARIISGADREVARKNILGPFNKQDFLRKLEQVNGDTLVSFTYYFANL
ncbi:hypothetical protein J7E24_01240 [Hymenobacter sp. ISL-91]|uniref:hypothetical protein n=1 Tax=Hymenobacter sp. ISL-91 TaxID=2819151 RepID=UPI001BED0ED1|nr:hypothetical protein [Hymenobacter sp. ISL-91]MBT2556400.1 hypothetical protein [Hymenobacter sp. ISL-91]